MLWALGKKGLVIKVPTFTELFHGLCARVMTSQTVMALAASPSVVRNLVMRVSFWSIQVGLGIFSIANAEPNTNGAITSHSMHTALPNWVVGWQTCGLWQGGKGHKIVEAMEHLGPEMAGPPSALLLTVDNSKKFDLCFILISRPFFPAAQESTLTPSPAHYII